MATRTCLVWSFLCYSFLGREKIQLNVLRGNLDKDSLFTNQQIREETVVQKKEGGRRNVQHMKLCRAQPPKIISVVTLIDIARPWQPWQGNAKP